MIKKGIFVAVFSLIFIIGSASNGYSISINISGTVTDLVTENNLTDVKVYITDQTNGRTDSVVTDGSGHWDYALISAIRNAEPLPVQFDVSQNYPNPFNPSTTIDITVPEGGEVQVTIYNILGAVIESQKAFLSRGNYSIEWDARGTAGIYFINVKTENRSITRKMTLIDGGFGKGLLGFRSAGTYHQSLPKIAQSVPITIRTKKFGYLDKTVESAVQGGETFNIEIETVHNAGFLADLHNDILEVMIQSSGYHWAVEHTYNDTDIPRLIRGGVDLQMFVVWVDPSTHLADSYNHAMNMVSLFNDEIALNPETIGQARNKTEALALHKEDKIAAVMCVEGGHAIEDDITKLKNLYNAGMRYLTITWNNSTDWAVSAQDDRSETVGLSDFGREVIRTLDTLGVIIDVSHTGIKTIEDILETTTNPIIASHSGVRAIRNHYRNLYDGQIIAIANSGGVIGIVFYPPFLVNYGSADIDDVADHIDYIVNLVGIDYVGIGSDFDGIGTNKVQGLYDTSTFPALTLELLSRGYSRSDVDKILGSNFLRVFGQVCKE